jgi:hypothetical protein
MRIELQRGELLRRLGLAGSRMRKGLLIALLLALAACRGEHVRTADDGIVPGTVVAIAELPVEDPAGASRSYDHLLVPEATWQVVVRLDGGGAITLTHSGERRYTAGERVRVLFGDEGALLL